jgi:hypothetical protein
MRGISLAAAALAIAPVPALAQDAGPSALESALAHSYLPNDIYSQLVRDAVAQKVDACQRAKLLSGTPQAKADIVARYAASFDRHFPAVQQDVAAALAGKMSDADLKDATSFLAGPAGRRLMNIAAATTGQAFSAAWSPCHLAAEPVDTAAMLREMQAGTSPDDQAAMHQFFQSSAGVAFGQNVMMLRPVLAKDMRELVSTVAHDAEAK